MSLDIFELACVPNSLTRALIHYCCCSVRKLFKRNLKCIVSHSYFFYICYHNWNETTYCRVLQQSGSQVAEPIIDRPGDRFIISGGSLIIVRTEPGDMGVYICTASNTVGNTSASFRLSVFGSASLVQAQITSFSNGVAMATALCHDTNQQGFEVRKTMIVYEIELCMAE